jgi:hypothetical protein
MLPEDNCMESKLAWSRMWRRISVLRAYVVTGTPYVVEEIGLRSIVAYRRVTVRGLDVTINVVRIS